jgi:ABC-type sugar transport system permease subunit
VERRSFTLFVLPSVSVMTALMVVPLGTTIWLSLTDLLLRDLDSAPFIGLGNYAEVLRDPDFWRATRFTLAFVAVTVPVEMALGIVFALLLDRVGRGRSFYLAALLLPFIVTPVVGTLLFRNLFSRGGLISWLVEVFTGEPFVIDGSNVRFLIMLHAIWHVTPFAFVSVFAGLQTLPQERVEAAAIDGGRFGDIFWHVTLPHLRSILFFVAIISIMDSYRVFDSVFVFAGNRFDDSHTLSVYNSVVALDAKIGRLGKGHAIAVLTIVGIFAALVPFLVRSYKEQIAERA